MLGEVDTFGVNIRFWMMPGDIPHGMGPLGECKSTSCGYCRIRPVKFDKTAKTCTFAWNNEWKEVVLKDGEKLKCDHKIMLGTRDTPEKRKVSHCPHWEIKRVDQTFIEASFGVTRC
jgi:hypothetical protein